MNHQGPPIRPIETVRKTFKKISAVLMFDEQGAVIYLDNELPEAEAIAIREYISNYLNTVGAMNPPLGAVFTISSNDGPMIVTEISKKA